jgi:hypothetical protein
LLLALIEKPDQPKRKHQRKKEKISYANPSLEKPRERLKKGEAQFMGKKSSQQRERIRSLCAKKLEKQSRKKAPFCSSAFSNATPRLSATVSLVFDPVNQYLRDALKNFILRGTLKD